MSYTSYSGGRYCIYLRKSRADSEAERRGEGETLARHEKALIELSVVMKITVSQIYREIVSGETIAARPAMQQLLTDIEDGKWDGVLCMEVERLARGDTVDQGIVAQTFKFSGTKIITPAKIYDPDNEIDEEYFEFGLFMSRREYKTINRRLQRGRIASVKEGKYTGNIAPYGYRRKKLEHDKGYTLEICPEEAEIVRKIYEWYTEGECNDGFTKDRIGTAIICHKLNNMHVPTLKNSVWVPATINGILSNPTYIGMIRWGYRRVEKKMSDGHVEKTRPRAKDGYIMEKGIHPSIISKEIFDKAQMYRAKNPPNPSRQGMSVKNPLSGLIVCGLCGRKMVRRPYSSGQKPSLICPLPSCPNVSCYLDAAEGKLLALLDDWVKTYELEWTKSVEYERGNADFKKKNMERLRADISKLEKHLEKTYSFLEQGIYTPEVFIERSKKISEEITGKKEQIKTLGVEIEKEESDLLSFKSIVPKIKKLLEVYNDLPTAKAKNDLLKDVIEKAVYKKEHRDRINTAGSIEMTIYPRIPKHKH